MSMSQTKFVVNVSSTVIFKDTEGWRGYVVVLELVLFDITVKPLIVNTPD